MPPRPDYTVTYKNNKRKRNIRKNKTRKVSMLNSRWTDDPIFTPITEDDLTPAQRERYHAIQKRYEYETSQEAILKKWKLYLEHPTNKSM
jgi:hypothetical protein